MNKETIITTIVALIIAILDFAKIFFGFDLGIGDEQVLAVVTFIVGVVCYWRNQSWTNGGWKGTQIGRLIKKREREGDLTLNDVIANLLEEE